MSLMGASDVPDIKEKKMNKNNNIIESRHNKSRQTMGFEQRESILPSKEFTDFLSKWSVKNSNNLSKEKTHLNMCPPYGSFSIPESEMENFFDKYEKEINEGKTLGIVEVPIADKNLPLVIDVDLVYSYEDTNDIKLLRRHNNHTIKSIIESFKKVYDKFFTFHNEDNKNKVYWIVSQREEPYISEKNGEKVVKDGIHIMNPMYRSTPSVHRKMRQIVLQDEMLERLIASLGTRNSCNDVFDEAVIYRNGWQMYGSTKPGKAPYDISYILNYHLKMVGQSDIGDNISMVRYLSYWRNTTRNAFPKPEILQMINNEERISFVTDQVTVTEENKKEEKEEKKEKKKPKKQKKQIEVVDSVDPENSEGGIIKKLSILADMFSERRAKIKSLWLEVGNSLKKMMYQDQEEEFLQIWINFSEKFGYFNEKNCRDEWENLDMIYCANLATFKFWAEKDAKTTAYEEMKKNNPKGRKKVIEDDYTHFKRNEVLDYLLKNFNSTHVDVAQTLYLMYESKFVCSSYKHNTWYEFDTSKNRWKEVEGGSSLRSKISKELASEYLRFDKFCEYMSENVGLTECPDLQHYKMKEEEWQKLWENQLAEIGHETWMSNIEGCRDLATKLKTKSFKDNILSEAKELFYDNEFEDKLNENHHLVGFENGVVDLDKHIFREGRPDDFITFSTKTKYLEFYMKSKEYKEIMAFYKQVYLSDEMVEYALKERAHSLHGDNKEEKFFAHIGSGGNGKSKTRELNTQSLGDYVIGFPVTLFTGKRTSSNAPMPELARSKGRRMVYVDEPEEGQRLNMGLMKKLTGGDPVEVRKLYGDVFEFIPQFTITILCNDPPKVPPHDEGTVRRLFCVPHDAKFTENPNPERKNEFKIDKTITHKIKKWKDVYASMLVDYYWKYAEEGLLPPEEVRKFTSEFLSECDSYNEFVEDILVETDDEEYISMQRLYNTFKGWVEERGIIKKPMPFVEFRKYLKKKLRKGDLVKETRLYGYREREAGEVSDS